MASSRSLKNLTGNWTMSRTLSSDMSPVLAMQGINIFMRKAAAAAPVYWAVSQPGEDELVVDQTTIASLPASKEEWTHDWKAREYKMGFIGNVSRRSRWTKADDVPVDDPFLAADLQADDVVLEEEISSVKGGWVARYVWRMEGVNLVRRLVIKKGKDKVEARLVYEPEE